MFRNGRRSGPGQGDAQQSKYSTAGARDEDASASEASISTRDGRWRQIRASMWLVLLSLPFITFLVLSMRRTQSARRQDFALWSPASIAIGNDTTTMPAAMVVHSMHLAVTPKLARSEASPRTLDGVAHSATGASLYTAMEVKQEVEVDAAKDVHGTEAQKRPTRTNNMVITAAFGNLKAPPGPEGSIGDEAYAKLSTFVLTLRRYFSGDIVILVDSMPTDARVLRLCSKMRVRLESKDFQMRWWETKKGRYWGFEGDSLDHSVKGGYRDFLRKRFVWYAELCSETSGICLAVDYRDTYFQGDPFLGISSDDGFDLLLVEEPFEAPLGKSLRQDTKWDSKWIVDCEGEEMLEDIGDNPILCAGSVYGTGTGFKEYHRLVEKYDAMNCNDQGSLNILHYSGQLAAAGLRVATETFVDGRVGTVGILGNRCKHLKKKEMSRCQKDLTAQFVGEDGVFRHAGGRAPAVLHQFDRIDALNNGIEGRLKEAESLVRVPAPLGGIEETYPLEDRFTTSAFARRVNAVDARRIEELLSHVDSSLSAHNVSYMIDGGSLIGSMLHHGRIPWDDDFDIYISVDDKDRAVGALQASGAYKVEDAYKGAPYMKVWSKTVPQVENNRKYTWPFVDIGLLKKNETHAWEARTSVEKYANNIYPLEILYPTVRRPFGNLVLSAPRDGERFLQSRFGRLWREKCVMANWDHRLEKVLDVNAGKGDELVMYPCAAIPDLPLVVRSDAPGASEGAVETLTVNGRPTQRASFDRGGNLIDLVRELE